MNLEYNLIFEKYNNVILNEGGAAGHMMHPFDLPTVNNLHDIVDVFYKAVDKLDKGESTVKLDGVNLSLKVVPTADGKGRQFALDRGSQKLIDVNGITIDILNQRFPEGHGMLSKGETILNIMNNSLPNIIDELKELGLYNDPTKFINTEYIEGQENVIDYGDKKLIAFHGINQFVEKRDRKNNVTRPGLKPKPNKKETSRPVKYDLNALESLREKVKPIATQYGFEVITGIYVNKKSDADFNAALNQPFTVVYDENESVTQPIKNWIGSLGENIPKTERVKLLDGKNKGAVSKDVYQLVEKGDKPLNQIFEEQDIPNAVLGALTYHVTRVLGNEVLRNYTTAEYGDTDQHEGIVITDVDYGKDELGNPNSLKITGEFIISGMGGMLANNRGGSVPEEEDQSAPAVNYGNGKMDFSSYFTNPRSEKDPGGSGFKGKSVK